MNLPLQAQPVPHQPLAEAVQQIETRLGRLQTELARLEQRLNHTRSEYWRTLRHLNEVKAKLATPQPQPRQEPVTLHPVSADDIDLTIYLDADWEHLMQQIHRM